MIANRRLGPFSARQNFSTHSYSFQTALSISSRSGVCRCMSVWADSSAVVRVLVDGVEVHHGSVTLTGGGERLPGPMWFFATDGGNTGNTWGEAFQLNLGFTTSLVIQVRSGLSGWLAGVTWYVEVEPI